MGDNVQKCIRTDYVAIVGTSQDFGLFYSLGAHPKQLARGALNNLSGLEDIFTGGMMASGNPQSGYRVIEEGDAKMKRNTDWANKMMFAAQGVRGLRMNSAGADYRTLIYFTTGYTSAQRAAIEAAGTRHGSQGRTFAISTSAELITRLNEATFPGSDCERRILRIDIYTHGLPEDLAFGYEGREDGTVEAQSFKAAQAVQLDPDRFNPPGRRSQIYSWGCRTAISRSGRPGGLAKVIADTTGAIVHAYARRTEYTNTWNTGGQSAAEARLVEIDSGSSLVLWHPDGARQGVIEGSSPTENPSGRFRYDSLDGGG